MKVKLLKRLRKKYTNWSLLRSIDSYEEFRIVKVIQRAQMKLHIDKYRLWYKLLTTITHKKDVDKT